jgi:DNA-binding response OmpR family regulator
MWPDAQGARIVVAEDDPAVLDLIVTRLSIAGYEPSFARDGRQALDVLRQVRPRALLLDINMPGLDGFGVLDAMRRSSDLQAVQTLVLTARHAPEDVRRAIGLGARDYLAKPFKDEALLARVARLVRPRRAAPPSVAPASSPEDLTWID